jgi:hypothetical protein
MKKFNYLMITAFGVSVVIAFVLMALPSGAATVTPDSYTVNLYKTELSVDGVNWITVFSEDINGPGKPIDLKSANVGSAFGSGAVPQGTYRVIKFTMKNQILYSYAASSISNAPFTPYPPGFEISPGKVEVYFSNIVTGFSWANNGTVNAPFPLPDPIRVVVGATSKVILNFSVTDSLEPVSGNLNPPTISVSNIVIQPTPPAQFTGGEYYFVRQNINLPADTASEITPTRMSLSSGWGKLTMSAPGVTGSGTCTIAPSDNIETRGEIQNQGLNIYCQTAEASLEMIGKYYIDGDGYINILFPYTDGIIRGSVRNDGKVFIAIEISTPSSQTASAQVGYHMIYAIQKGPLEGSITATGNYAYSMYFSSVATATDGSNPRPDEYNLTNSLMIGCITATASAEWEMGTQSRIDIRKPLSPTAQTITAPSMEYYASGQQQPITFTSQGRCDLSKEWLTVLPDKQVGIFAGSTLYPFETWGDTITKTATAMEFGVLLKMAPISTHTIANVAGNYTFVYKGDSWDTNMGNRLPSNWVMLGRISFDGAGNATGSYTKSERGQTVIEPLNMQYEIIGDWIGATPQASTAIYVDVIRMYNPLEPQFAIKMLISEDGKTLSPYAPPGTPGNVNPERGLGLAIKQN